MPMDSAGAVDVTVVEEGVLGSGRTDYAAGDVSVAGTDEGTDAGDDGTVDDIPVFRLGDVGNTGPIPHYSPACKASPSMVPARPLSTIKSAGKHAASAAARCEDSPAGSAPPSSSRRRRRSSGAAAKSTPGDARPAAPANTPATGARPLAANAANAAALDLSGYAANIAQTPGGHAKHGAVARILAMEEAAAEAAAVDAADVTMEEDIDGAADFVEAIEAAAAAEAAEAAADAGAAAAQELGAMNTEEFDFDEVRRWCASELDLLTHDSAL